MKGTLSEIGSGSYLTPIFFNILVIECLNIKIRMSEAIPSFDPPQAEHSTFFISGPAGQEVCH
jgi:hypothetical protein